MRGILRKAAAACAGLGLIAALSGCGSAASGNDKTLVVYSADPANAKVYQSVLDDFGKAHGVQVQLTSYPSADFIQNFTSAVNGRSQIDVLLANGQDVRYLKSKGLAADLTGKVDTSQLLPAAYKPFEINNGLYAAGIGGLNVTAFVYNADIFAKYGLTVPKTLDDVVADAQKLKGTNIAPVSVPGGTPYLWPIWLMQTIQQTSKNTPTDTTFKTLQSDSPSFDSPVYQNALAALGKLGAGNVFANGYQALQQDAAASLFAQGKAAMFFGGTWDVSSIVTQAPNLKVKMFPFPNFVPGIDSTSFGGVGIAAATYGKVADSRRDLANQLVAYLASPSVDKTLMKGTTTSIALPAAKGVQPDSGNPLQQQIIDQLVPETSTFLDWYWPKEVTAEFQKDIPAVIAGTQTPAQAASDVEATFKSAKANGWVFN